MPGDVGGFMAHEVADVERAPEVFLRFKGLGRERQLHHGFAFAGFDFGCRVGRTTAEHGQGQAVGVFQQFAFPGGPHFGAGAANIGHGEQVQGGEPALGADAVGKGLNDVGVGQVLLLRDLAHGQVLVHEEFDQLGVGFVDLVGAAKAFGFQRADDGVVTATAFADVVEQGGDVQNPGLVPAGGQL